MDVFLARQPIFDACTHLYGYELLYRADLRNWCDTCQAERASAHVLNTFLTLGAERVIGNSRAFVNFSRDLLVDEGVSILPPQIAVIEILESVEPDAEVLAACRRLRQLGYLLALDDVVDTSADQFAEFADIIKVDFRATTSHTRKMLVERYAPRGVRMLAEKVETPAEFDEARRDGYVLFQGYFFARPVVLKGRDIPGFKLNYLRILSEIHHPSLEFGRLERLISREISVAYKLLKYVNSPLFMPCNQIESIGHALALLGETEIRKWVSLVVLMHLTVDKPSELVTSALLRAGFCESIARLCGLAARKDELFLMGLFSLLDAIMDRPLQDVLSEVHLAEDLSRALLGHGTNGDTASAVYDLILSYEQAEWDRVRKLADQLGLQYSEVTDCYLASVNSCNQVFAQAAFQPPRS